MGGTLCFPTPSPQPTQATPVLESPPGLIPPWLFSHTNSETKKTFRKSRRRGEEKVAVTAQKAKAWKATQNLGAGRTPTMSESEQQSGGLHQPMTLGMVAIKATRAVP